MPSTKVTKKSKGRKLMLRTLEGKNGTYLFFKDPSGSYHAFLEVDTKKALRDCGGMQGTTRQVGKKLLGF